MALQILTNMGLHEIIKHKVIGRLKLFVNKERDEAQHWDLEVGEEAKSWGLRSSLLSS